MAMRIMYCNNCGERGHVFKSCKYPIISCGIILLKTLDTKEVLMVRRKDSMAFTEFLRGKYSPDDIPYIKKLLMNMTTQEQERLCVTGFEKLWQQLWGFGRDHHSHEYEQSKVKFESLNLADIVATLGDGYTESEWGFPKGRRASRETDLKCAIREFTEETNIPREAYVVCNNLILEETFAGTNNVKYKHIYFIAFLRDEVNLKQKMTSTQKREVSAIAWKTLDECRHLTRPHYSQRKEMLDSLERILNTFDLQDNIATNQE